MNKIIFDILPSTSTYIRENMSIIDDNCYVVAKMQSSGRGRSGKSWLSKEGNLMFSFKIKLDRGQSLITLLAGVAVKEAIDKITNKSDTLIKWPNDVMINDKKVCGILCENIKNNNESKIIIGIGINVNQIYFDSSIKEKASSLINIYHKEFDCDILLTYFDEIFSKYLAKFKTDLANTKKHLINAIRQNNYLLNKEFLITSGEKNNKYKCVDITEDGLLDCINENGNRIQFNSGEISLTSTY